MKCTCDPDCDPCKTHGFCHMCETEEWQMRVYQLKTSIRSCRMLCAVLAMWILLIYLAKLFSLIYS